MNSSKIQKNAKRLYKVASVFSGEEKQILESLAYKIWKHAAKLSEESSPEEKIEELLKIAPKYKTEYEKVLKKDPSTGKWEHIPGTKHGPGWELMSADIEECIGCDKCGHDFPVMSGTPCAKKCGDCKKYDELWKKHKDKLEVFLRPI